jgi:hypothetical protein
MTRIFLAAMILTAFPAFADEMVDAKTCSYLTAHKPDADVEYQPGVDVSGKPVVEADISPSVVTAPTRFEFPVTLNLAQKIGLPIPYAIEGNMTAGTVTYDNGTLFFNGKPMEGEAEANLKALCNRDKNPSE